MLEVVSLRKFLTDAAALYFDRVAFSIIRKGLASSFTYQDVLSLTLKYVDAIRLKNLGPEDKIAIILDSSPEYAAAFFASGLLNHPCVLIDAKLGIQEIDQILHHSDSKLILSGFGSRTMTEKVSESSSIPFLMIDEISFTKLSKEKIHEELGKFKGLDPQDVALLVYTSGTTSDPKGVMITLENLLFNGQATIKAMGPHDNSVFLSILPMNHLLEFSGGMMTPFRLGAHVVYANTIMPHEIIERFSLHRYTDMIVVPLFLRTMMKSFFREINKSGFALWYYKIAVFLSNLIPLIFFRRILFYPFIKKLGFIKRFVSGGAALEVKTQKFFNQMGIIVSQGYGLTETSPVTTVTSKDNRLLGTQGRAIPGTEIKVHETSGEILIRGPHVMKGYYKRPEFTADAIDSEGWFKSGDLGYLDQEGNLFVTGRLKELIVLGSGKKVFPDEVELSINYSGNIKDLIIVGAIESSGPMKGTETVCAVVVPSEEMVKKYEDINLMKEELIKEIKKKSEVLAVYKRPGRILFSFQDLPKTSSKKTKRTVIKKMIEDGEFS